MIKKYQEYVLCFKLLDLNACGMLNSICLDSESNIFLLLTLRIVSFRLTETIGSVSIEQHC